MSIIILSYLPAIVGIGVVAWLTYLRRGVAVASYTSFTVALIFILIWQLTQMISLLMTGNGALDMVRLSLAIANLMTPALLMFAILFPGTGRLPYWLVALICLPALILFPLSFTPSMVESVYYIDSAQYLKTGFLYDIQTIYTVLYTLASVVILAVKAFGKRGNERYALLFVSFSFLIPLVTASIVSAVSHDNSSVALYFVPVSFLAMTLAISYAMIRYRLFDVKLAAVRSLAYAGALVTLSGIYYLVAYLMSTLLLGQHVSESISVGPTNIVLALILALLFQPVKKFFDMATDKVFYRDSYESDDFFAALSNLLTSTVELRGLLERASKQIADTLKAEQAFFFVYYQNGRAHHTSAGTVGHERMPVHDAHMLDQLVLDDLRPVYITDLMADDNATRRMLRSHKVALAMPLLQGKKITGYVFLGDKKSGNYTKRDLNVLSTVSNELVIAIQNALSLHEVKELNATLQQRIDIATKELRSSNAQLKHLDEVKDEFMSMASHQLRTPLTSVKGYLSMVVEGDAGKISPQQQKLLTEAFKSSERMVRLISDFLDVSRLQTGKFVVEKAPFDLADVVKQEVQDLELIAHSHDLKLRLNIRGSVPMFVNADEQKMRQVIMNYIDNAIYYSSPKSTIIINLEHVKSEAALTVVDTGIGVPEDVQSRLFTKFFRAANARQRRPDGTGVGLYLTRRVLNAHNGSIIFSSKEGKGSTFGFRLPLIKAPAVPVVKKTPVKLAKENK